MTDTIGETDLKTLLTSMRPVLHDAPYVFCSLSRDAYDRLSFEPLCVFREQEGITVAAEQRQAVADELPVDILWACITLTVHSSLSAVGFLAAITGRLAQAGISVNAISAYYHDHLFVKWEARQQVMALLEALGQPQAPPTSTATLP